MTQSPTQSVGFIIMVIIAFGIPILALGLCGELKTKDQPDEYTILTGRVINSCSNVIDSSDFIDNDDVFYINCQALFNDIYGRGLKFEDLK